MASPAPKSLITVTVGAIAATTFFASGEPADAALLTYDFQVLLNQGWDAGTTHTGYFSFDSSKLVPCLTAPSRLCATPGQSNFTLNFNFLGVTYTEKSDVDYLTSGLQFPAVYFPGEVSAGLDPVQLSLIVNTPTAPVNFAVLGNRFFMGFTGRYPNETGPFQGTVSYALRPSKPPDPPPGPLPDPSDPPPICTNGCTAVPEPSELAGSVAAIVGIGFLWRWRRRGLRCEKSDFKK